MYKVSITVRTLIFLSFLLFMVNKPASAQVGPCLFEPSFPPSTIQGAPFFNCGEPTGAQTPFPTASPHAFQIDSFSVCVSPGFSPQSWMFPQTFPDIVVESSNVIILNAATLPGTIHIEGNGVQWWDVLGGSFANPPILGPFADNVEVNGECLRGVPLPEPNSMYGLLLGCLTLLFLRKRAKALS